MKLGQTFLSVSSHFQGLENSLKRHKDAAEYFHMGLEKMGLKLFVEDKVLILQCLQLAKSLDRISFMILSKP